MYYFQTKWSKTEIQISHWVVDNLKTAVIRVHILGVEAGVHHLSVSNNSQAWKKSISATKWVCFLVKRPEKKQKAINIRVILLLGNHCRCGLCDSGKGSPPQGLIGMSTSSTGGQARARASTCPHPDGAMALTGCTPLTPAPGFWHTAVHCTLLQWILQGAAMHWWMVDGGRVSQRWPFGLFVIKN